MNEQYQRMYERWYLVYEQKILDLDNTALVAFFIAPPAVHSIKTADHSIDEQHYRNPRYF